MPLDKDSFLGLLLSNKKVFGTLSNCFDLEMSSIQCFLMGADICSTCCYDVAEVGRRLATTERYNDDGSVFFYVTKET